MKTPILKGLMQRLILLGTSAKTASWKARRPYVKEMHCLILKHLPEGQGSAGTLSRDGGAGACHFCTLLPFCLLWDGAPIPPFKICKNVKLVRYMCQYASTCLPCQSLWKGMSQSGTLLWIHAAKHSRYIQSIQGMPCLWAKGNLCIWAPQVWKN